VTPVLHPRPPCGGGSRPMLTPGCSPRPRPLQRSRRAAAPVRPAWSLATPLSDARARSTGPSVPASTRVAALAQFLCPTLRALHGAQRARLGARGCTARPTLRVRRARTLHGPAGPPRRARAAPAQFPCPTRARSTGPSRRASTRGAPPGPALRLALREDCATLTPWCPSDLRPQGRPFCAVHRPVSRLLFAPCLVPFFHPFAPRLVPFRAPFSRSRLHSFTAPPRALDRSSRRASTVAARWLREPFGFTPARHSARPFKRYRSRRFAGHCPGHLARQFAGAV
jgi:hypothetical protein